MKRLSHIVKPFILVIVLLMFCQLSWSEPTLNKEQYNQRLKQWKQLTPEQQKTILNNYKQYQKMATPEKQVVQQNFQEWQKLPEPEKEKIRIEVREFKKLPTKQKALLIERKRQYLNGEKPSIEFRKQKTMPPRLEKPRREPKTFEKEGRPKEPRKIVDRAERTRRERGHLPRMERREPRGR